ncbi:MAG TPA: site-specific DNA-methyltransferase [Eubacteriaceae bacterium]|nr:site-specific DNA-methyltransferase [Eubacteriaceae bacterium]
MHTQNLADDNFAALAAMFPNAVTETIDENGEIIRAIDAEVLAQEINTRIVSGKEERYQFTWPDKKKSVLMANAPIAATLRPCREESVDFDATENLYIEGDNLDVLKLLRETYLNRVKMIYIDPPYNTGKDFIYEDDFKEATGEFLKRDGQYDEQGNRLTSNFDSNGRFHTDWLNMIYPRLRVARDLLTDDGVIFISIDEKEYSNVKKICDEIFGEKNYFGDLVWEATTQPINAGSAKFGLQKKTESILFYGKKKNAISGFELEELSGSLNYPHIGKYGACRFEIIEKSDAGDYSRPTMKFAILGQQPREGKRWQIGEDTARKLENDGKVEIVDGIVKKAVYPEDEIDKKQYKPFWSLLLANEVGTAQTGKDELNSIMDRPIGFDTVKPTQLIKKIVSYLGKETTVMDFFSGSATTAHAVMQLNAEDGGNRKFIMVQLPEVCSEGTEAAKAGYANICEIGKERIRRAGAKIKEENKDKEGIENLDTGFRVLKLDSSNMKEVYYTPEEYSQMGFNLEGFMDNIKPDRSDEDLLFQVMLDLGIPLSAKINQEGKVIYVNDNYLIACFDKVDTDTITEIAKKQPYYAVFRDSSFLNDSALVNVEQVFKTYSPSSIRRVL